MVFNTGPCTVLPDNSILITANMQSETGFPSSHQLKSYVAYMSRLKLAARAVLSADAGLLVQTKSRLRPYPAIIILVNFANYRPLPQLQNSLHHCHLYCPLQTRLLNSFTTTILSLKQPASSRSTTLLHVSLSTLLNPAT